jgi:hypothetical protein
MLRCGAVNRLNCLILLECPHAGFWCAGALTTTSGNCNAGYYCPAGTQVREDGDVLPPTPVELSALLGCHASLSCVCAMQFATQYACPAGYYSASTSLTAVQQCTPCGLGNYCVAASTVPLPCPATTYSNSTTTGALASCLNCPMGYACPQGTGNPVPCGAGYFSAPSASACSICPAGSYCPTNSTTSVQVASSYLCPAGFYCAAGVNDEPDFTYHTCWPGSYCPRGTPFPGA